MEDDASLLSLGIHDLKHTMLEVFELIIIDVYGSTVFGVVYRLRIIFNAGFNSVKFKTNPTSKTQDIC